MAAIIKTEDLHFSYPAAEGVMPVVLDGVSLSIEEGSFVAQHGHEGALLNGQAHPVQHHRHDPLGRGVGEV